MDPSPDRPVLSIVTPTLNESDNVEELVSRVRLACEGLSIEYEHIVIDNCSTDGTWDALVQMAQADERLRLIRNERDYGHIRSPFYGLLQASGDAAVLMASDLQDPPELIPDLVGKWRQGSKVVFLVKRSSAESSWVSLSRRVYYRALGKMSSSPLIGNATGAGLYDRSVVDVLRSIGDPYPYLRGLVAELGYPVATVLFDQPRRKRGNSKNGLGTLVDLGLLGLSTHSRTPLRLMSLAGFALAALSLLIGMLYGFRKLFDWDSFDLGLAPIAVGLFFLGAVQLICFGILGEYIGNIFIYVRKHPLVVEAERVNFDRDQGNGAA